MKRIAIFVALAFVLSFVKLYELPNGGSLTPAMFPILLYALRWGLGRGLGAGFLFGLLQLIFDGAYAWGWQSMLLDYLVAFTVLGLGMTLVRSAAAAHGGTVLLPGFRLRKADPMRVLQRQTRLRLGESGQHEQAHQHRDDSQQLYVGVSFFHSFHTILPICQISMTHYINCME